MFFPVLSSIVAAGQTFTCTATHVWDGDGPMWCAEGPKIRLAGIAARDIDETCKRGIHARKQPASRRGIIW